MNSETYYRIKPNLTEEHRAELLAFLTTKGYSLSSTFGEAISLLCRIENAKEGREEISLSSTLNISMEDTLSESISIFDASDILSNALAKLEPERSLAIIDPYLFPKNPDKDYIEFFFSVFGKTLSKVQNVNIFTGKGFNEKIKLEIEGKIIKDHNASVNIKATDVFHDRFWITDESKGIFIGTSLNGIGKKYSIFDFLKENDVSDIVARLQSF